MKPHFSERERKVLDLRENREMTYTAIAKEIGLSVSRASQIYRQARLKQNMVERREAERQKALLNEYTGFSGEDLDFFFEGLRWYQRQLRAELPEVAETYLAIEALKKKLVAMMYRETL